MTDPSIPINSIDTLHAHFAVWIRFLEAKGQELESQLAKLEARKVKVSALPSASVPSYDPKQTTHGTDFLSIAFSGQANVGSEAFVPTVDDKPMQASDKIEDPSTEFSQPENKAMDGENPADYPDESIRETDMQPSTPIEVLEIKADSSTNRIVSDKNTELV